MSSRRKIVDVLIRKGAPLNERNKRLEAPLHLAADHAMLDIIDLLARKYIHCLKTIPILVQGFHRLNAASYNTKRKLCAI